IRRRLVRFPRPSLSDKPEETRRREIALPSAFLVRSCRRVVRVGARCDRRRDLARRERIVIDILRTLSWAKPRFELAERTSRAELVRGLRAFVVTGAAPVLRRRLAGPDDPGDRSQKVDRADRLVRGRFDGDAATIDAHDRRARIA